jgi:competence protein ComEA
VLERFKYPIFITLALAITVGVIALLSYRPPPVMITIRPPVPTATRAPTATPGPIQVYVTGAVRLPEKLYKLPSGSRAIDAITAAGGFASEADPASVNLAQILRDGDQIHVRAANSSLALALATATPNDGRHKDASPEQPVHINTADEQELQRLPGVGPVLAKAIVEYRVQNGAFRSMQDLDNVPGIGPGRLADWAGLIVFE